MLGPKVKPVRDERYRRYISTQPCISCGIESYSQAAHPNFGRGLGQKSSDHDTFPLCSTRPGHPGCHVQFDQLWDMTLAERRELEIEYTARMRAQAKRDGWFKEELAA